MSTGDKLVGHLGFSCPWLSVTPGIETDVQSGRWRILATSPLFYTLFDLRFLCFHGWFEWGWMLNSTGRQFHPCPLVAAAPSWSPQGWNWSLIRLQLFALFASSSCFSPVVKVHFHHSAVYREALTTDWSILSFSFTCFATSTSVVTSQMLCNIWVCLKSAKSIRCRLLIRPNVKYVWEIHKL